MSHSNLCYSVNTKKKETRETAYAKIEYILLMLACKSLWKYMFTIISSLNQINCLTESKMYFLSEKN